MRLSFFQILFLISVFLILFYNNSLFFTNITKFLNSFLQNVKKNKLPKK